MKMLFKITFFILGLLSQAGFAQRTDLYEIQRSGCRMVRLNRTEQKFERSSKTFARGSRVFATKVKPGQKIFAKQFSARSKMWVIQDPMSRQDFYLVSERCAIDQGGMSSEIKAIESSFFSRKAQSFYIGFGPESWHSNVKYISTSNVPLSIPGEVLELNSNTIAASLETGARFQASRFEYSFGMDFVYGRAEAKKTLTQSLDASLDPISSEALQNLKNIPVYGWHFVPQIDFRPLSKNVAVGFSLPLGGIYTVWPADTDRAITPRFTIDYALAAQLRLERLPWSFSQSIGLYRGFKNVVWRMHALYSF